jgi:ParB/RepB/Spo0J family partition protein
LVDAASAAFLECASEVEGALEQFRCTYCQALIPWAVESGHLGLKASEQPSHGQLYPYDRCACGYGKFVVFEAPGQQAESANGLAATLVERTYGRVLAARYARLPVATVRPNPKQPRKFFDAEALRGLAESIKTVGLLEDILVRPVESAMYEIVLGERRWRASQLAGVDTISAKVVDLDDQEVRLIALTENIHREDLTNVEEAFSFKAYVDEGRLQTDVGHQLGGMQQRVAERLKTLNSHYYVRYQEERIAELQRILETLREQVKVQSVGRYEAVLVAADKLTNHLAEGFEVAAALPDGRFAVRRRIA